MMTRPATLRPLIRWGLIVALLLLPMVLPAVGQRGDGETLYNGMHLPLPCPLQLAEIPPKPVTPAYLTAPPAVIRSDLGHHRLTAIDDKMKKGDALLALAQKASPFSQNGQVNGISTGTKSPDLCPKRASPF
jgi:hypothetical protein